MGITTICVFCGSGTGKDPVFSEAAAGLGRVMAERKLNLVYGGSNIGLMGIVSAAVRDAGGRVTGVIPERIADRVPTQPGIHLEVVPDMHARKSRMYDISDAFIAMPGGIGTMDELFEAWTWNQLGYHSRALGLLNIAGYYNPLIGFLDRMTDEDFLRRSQRESLFIADDAVGLLDSLERWNRPEGLKWDRD